MLFYCALIRYSELRQIQVNLAYYLKYGLLVRAAQYFSGVCLTITLNLNRPTIIKKPY